MRVLRSTKVQFWGACLLLAGPVLAGCGGAASEGSPAGSPSSAAVPGTVGTPAPEPADAVPAVLRFSAPTVSGGTFDGTTLAGRPAALWFWAPWCPTCRRLGPDVARLAATYQGKLQVVGVAGLSSDAGSMKDFVSDTGITGFESVADTGGDVYTRFGITSQDNWVFVAADGTVTEAAGLGPAELEDAFAELTS